jgi:hypothetical protein
LLNAVSVGASGVVGVTMGVEGPEEIDLVELQPTSTVTATVARKTRTASQNNLLLATFMRLIVNMLS